MKAGSKFFHLSFYYIYTHYLCEGVFSFGLDLGDYLRCGSTLSGGEKNRIHEGRGGKPP